MDSLNISQSLFQLDEKLVAPSKDFSSEFPAFLNQSRISTYFQDNPFPTVTFPMQFGLSPLGGAVNTRIGSGSKPALYKEPEPEPVVAQSYGSNVSSNTNPVMANGFMVPKYMAGPISKRM